MAQDDGSALAALLEAARASRYPPVERWEPAHCGDIAIRIAADGTWYHEGRPIRRPELVKLFSRVLRRDADGAFYLVTPVEKMRIQVDDAPLHVCRMDVSGTGPERRIVFQTLTEDIIPLDAEHPLTMRPAADGGELRPYVRARGRLDAVLLRPVYYELARHLDEGTDAAGRPVWGVWSTGRFFPLQPVTEEDEAG
ncbi:MAG: hypothetical protein KatS3mg119_1121 [Rhodothalassiaceae bacterium]|nr:MAG: hypothetical protein KatS3mg119_1121 [Rhodothalassiaceae bacterium]